jgi:hypothetical protein
MNPAKTSEARASQKVREHSFCLIVRRMCHCDSGANAGIRQRAEIVIPSTPRGILEVSSFLSGLLRDVERRGVKLQVVLGGQPGGEFFVGVGGFAAQFVVEMHDAQDDTQLFTQFEEQEQQRHGIRTAGYGHADAIASAYHSLTLECREQLFVEMMAA